MVRKVKLVYKDGNITKLIFGVIYSEDEFFIEIIAEDGISFRINKSSVISIKELREEGFTENE